MTLQRASFLASVAAAITIACGGPIAAAPAPSVDPGRIVRLVTWNVHDLFDEIDRTSSPGDADTVLTAAGVKAKLDAVGRVLARIDPDVAILQEVENQPLLVRLASGPLAGRGYEAFLREGRDPRGIDIGVLSRLPFEAGPSHLDERAPGGRLLWSRDPVDLRVSIAPRPLALVGAHLISRLDPSDDGQRLDQATRLRELAEERRAGPDDPCVLVLGDLNDLPAAPSLVPLLGDGAWVDLGRSMPAPAAWTWSGSGLHERMDYALVAREDEALVMRVQVEDGADVRAASDHRPLVVDLWLGRVDKR